MNGTDTMGLKIVYEDSGEEMTIPIPAGYAIRALPLWRTRSQGLNPSDAKDRTGETLTGERIKITMMDLLANGRHHFTTDKNERVSLDPEGWQFVIRDLSTGYEQGIARVASINLFNQLKLEDEGLRKSDTSDLASMRKDDIENVRDHVATAYLMAGTTTVRRYR